MPYTENDWRYYSQPKYDDYLAHYGVKGMKWGKHKTTRELKTLRDQYRQKAFDYGWDHGLASEAVKSYGERIRNGEKLSVKEQQDYLNWAKKSVSSEAAGNIADKNAEYLDTEIKKNRRSRVTAGKATKRASLQARQEKIANQKKAKSADSAKKAANGEKRVNNAMAKVHKTKLGKAAKQAKNAMATAAAKVSKALKNNTKTNTKTNAKTKKAINKHKSTSQYGNKSKK